MKIKRVLILLLLFLSCKKISQEQEVNSLKSKVVDKNELLQNWKVFKKGEIKVNLPENWKPKNVDDVMFYVPLKFDNNDLYYAILNYKSSIINSRNYLKESFNQVSKKDSKFTYILNKIELQNTNNCYIVEFHTFENKIKYKIYTLIYEVGGELYDFSFKTLDDKKFNDKNYQIYYTILFSFEYKYDNIIDSKKFIVKGEKSIKYEDL